jgi:hypothetical protein
MVGSSSNKSFRFRFSYSSECWNGIGYYDFKPQPDPKRFIKENLCSQTEPEQLRARYAVTRGLKQTLEKG